MVLAVGATAGKAFEVTAGSTGSRYHDLWVGGRLRGRGREGPRVDRGEPQYAMPLYNLACAESLAGHPEDAIRHLGMAIERWDGGS